MYLHGTWEYGEYSFSLAPFSTSPKEDIPVAEENKILVNPDPHVPDFLISKNTDGSILTIHRDQEKITGATIVTADDSTIHLHVDQRLRPTRIENHTEGVYLTLHWAEDSTQITVTTDDNGFVSQETTPFDFSDNALIAAAQNIEQNEGMDLTHFKQWVQENPGHFAALAQGQTASPNVLLPPLTSSYLKDGENPYNYDFFIELMYGLAGYLSLLGGSTALAVAGPHIAVVALGIYATAILLGIGLVVIFANLYFYFTDIKCDPCNLACFVNCV